MTETTTQATGDNSQAAEGTQTTDTSTATAAAPAATETKAGEAATTTTAAEAEVVYDFKLPEGMELDATTSDSFKAIAKELKLPAEAAQRIVDLETQRIQAAAQAHVDTVKAWRESVVNDKDIGGDHLAENIATAKKAIALGPPELTDLLKTTGMDNHPTVFRWALAVGKALSEDHKVVGGSAPTGQKDTASVLYPSKT
jgi:hypothetical protein